MKRAVSGLIAVSIAGLGNRVNVSVHETRRC